MAKAKPDEIMPNGFWREPMHKKCPNCHATPHGIIPPEGLTLGEKFGWECTKCQVVFVVEVTKSLMHENRLKLEWKRSVASGR